MERLGVFRHQRHTLLTAGDQHGAQVKAFDQLTSAADQLVIGLTMTGHGFEFAQVRRDQGRATVLFKVRAFRVDQHRRVLSSGGLNQRLWIIQRAFAVIRQNHHRSFCHTGLIELQQFSRIRVGAVFFKIETDQLLLTADDAQLGDGRALRMSTEVTADTSVFQQATENRGVVVFTDHADQIHGTAECGDVQRDVTGTTGTVFSILNFHHRHRGFR